MSALVSNVICGYSHSSYVRGIFFTLTVFRLREGLRYLIVFMLHRYSLTCVFTCGKADVSGRTGRCRCCWRLTLNSGQFFVRLRIMIK